MDIIAVGIDVSKDRLNVAVRPGGEAFTAERNGSGPDRLVAKLGMFTPTIVAMEVTGGFETIAAAALASASLPVVVINPPRSEFLPRRLGNAPKQIQLTLQ
jgi:transposase